MNTISGYHPKQSRSMKRYGKYLNHLNNPDETDNQHEIKLSGKMQGKKVTQKASEDSKTEQVYQDKIRASL